MTRRLLTAALCVVALESGGQALGAQTANWLTLGGGARAIRLQSRFATGASSDVSGVAVGASSGVEFGRLALALGYWQGGLDAAPPGTQKQDVIDGYALLALRATSWLKVKGGAEARSYVTAAGTEHWLFWQARLRAERMIVNPSIRGHVEIWRALSTEVNTPVTVDRAQGGEVGVTLRRALGPLWARLTYGIDDVRLVGSARRQTLEALAFTVGYGGK
ncbi:MAG TPA: hypothetical protein VJ755_12605 [Gemmatimonadales bacterium]|nr:hypothetical protein [Gemmatimonadales bacterium]